MQVLTGVQRHRSDCPDEGCGSLEAIAFNERMLTCNQCKYVLSDSLTTETMFRFALILVAVMH